MQIRFTHVHGALSVPIVLFLFFLAIACGPEGSQMLGKKKLIEIDSINAFGEREQYYILPENGIKEGPLKRWSPNGHLMEEAFYSDGQLDQMRILYYENGDTQIVETYQIGMFHGPYRLYYPGEKLQWQATYQKNSLEGVCIKYYESGGVMEEVTFHENSENGPFREFYPDGTLKTEGQYRNGDREHGELKFYDESGRHYKTMHCEDGLCRTVWKSPS